MTNKAELQEILDILKDQARALEERPSENIDARGLDKTIEFVEKSIKEDEPFNPNIGYYES